MAKNLKGGAATLLKRLHAEHDYLVKNTDFGQYLDNNRLCVLGEQFYVTSIKLREDGQFGPKYELTVRMVKPTKSYKESRDDNHGGVVKVYGTKPVEIGIITMSASDYRTAFFGGMVEAMNWTLEPGVEEEGEIGPFVLTQRGKMYDLATPNVETNDGDEVW